MRWRLRKMQQLCNSAPKASTTDAFGNSAESAFNDFVMGWCSSSRSTFRTSWWVDAWKSKNNVMGSLQRMKILQNLVGRQEGLMSFGTCQLVLPVRVFVLASLARLFPPGFLASQLCCSESEDSSDLNSWIYPSNSLCSVYSFFMTLSRVLMRTCGQIWNIERNFWSATLASPPVRVGQQSWHSLSGWRLEDFSGGDRCFHCGVGFCGKQVKALVDGRLEALGSLSSIDQSALMTFSGAAERHCALLCQILGLNIVHTPSHACLAFAKVALSIFFAFVLALQSPVVGGLVQLKSDELGCDIDAAIDLQTGEAQEWEQKFRIVDGSSVWTHGDLQLDDGSDIAVLTDLCFCSGLRVGSNSEWFDWSQVVAWFPHGGDGEKATPSASRPRSVHDDALATNPWLTDIFGASRPALTICSSSGLGCVCERLTEERPEQRRSSRRCSDKGRYLPGVEASWGPLGGRLWRRRQSRALQHRHTRRRMDCCTSWCSCKWSSCIRLYSTCSRVLCNFFLRLYCEDTCAVPAKFLVFRMTHFSKLQKSCWGRVLPDVDDRLHCFGRATCLVAVETPIDQ